MGMLMSARSHSVLRAPDHDGLRMSQRSGRALLVRRGLWRHRQVRAGPVLAVLYPHYGQYYHPCSPALFLLPHQRVPVQRDVVELPHRRGACPWPIHTERNFHLLCFVRSPSYKQRVEWVEE